MSCEVEEDETGRSCGFEQLSTVLNYDRSFMEWTKGS
jgi:hypothetical protein